MKMKSTNFLQHNRSNQSGFTLLEILISLVILAIGLLGLASLQATGLKNNQSAYHRSQATQLSYDISDRIRSNIAGLSTYIAITPSSAVAKAGCVAIAGTCAAEDMAQNDLFEWNTTLTNILPKGKGTITTDSSGYTIAITWDDDHDGNDANNINIQTSIRP